MKGMHLFCASPASTTICVSRPEHKSMVRHQRSSQSPSKPKPGHPQSRKTTSAKQTDLLSPLSSTTYLLSDKALFHIFADLDSLHALVPAHSNGPAPVFRPSSTPRDQVVMLRVSLHCKGCEAKVRKHISRIKGVKFFDIDFPTKKVTIVGDITPLGVLASLSRAKKAQIWPSPP